MAAPTSSRAAPTSSLLDRPIWNSLTTRQAHRAQGGPGCALRFAPEYGVFAAAADDTPGSQSALAALCPTGGAVALFEIADAPTPPDLTEIERGPILQMIAEILAPGDTPSFAVMPLSDADGPEMLALATLTKPGPFFVRTHQLGDFVGVKVDGQLAAMAGERMRIPGFTEVSGVCTHPDHRGHGYAAALTRTVAANILARGEAPFMHVFPNNTGALSVYQALGFKLRREMKLAVFGRDRRTA